MKRIILLLAVVVSLSSCEKDWTCNCYNPRGGFRNSFVMENHSKSEAKSGCANYGNMASGSSIGYCELEE